jgi:hypothetical protein
VVDLKAVQRPISALRVAANLSIPGSPDWVGIGSDAVWISNKAKDSIARIDPITDRIIATVPVGRVPCSVSVSKLLESTESVGFQRRWPDSLRGRRCGRLRTDRNTIVIT